MAENFPYFKFIATEWLTGNIVYEDMKLQGLFINICALYWQRNGTLFLDDLYKRYPKHRKDIDELCQNYLNINDGQISIQFLDEQLLEANHISAIRKQAGAKGGQKSAIAKQVQANAKQNQAKKNKRKEEINKSKEEKNIAFTAPTRQDVIDFFKEKGYGGADRAFDYYAASNWMDSRGNMVKNWKQKMIAVWFKDENKITTLATSTTDDHYANSRNILKTAQ
jgi:hypothetical protein